MLIVHPPCLTVRHLPVGGICPTQRRGALSLLDFFAHIHRRSVPLPDTVVEVIHRHLLLEQLSYFLVQESAPRTMMGGHRRARSGATRCRAGCRLFRAWPETISRFPTTYILTPPKKGLPARYPILGESSVAYAELRIAVV